MSASPPMSTGTIASRPPTNPTESTSWPVANAPSAYPVLPPMLKYDIPLARLAPLAYAANFAPSGWNAATPSPPKNTSTTTSG